MGKIITFPVVKLTLYYKSGRVFNGSFSSLEGVNNFLSYVERVGSVYCGFMIEN